MTNYLPNHAVEKPAPQRSRDIGFPLPAPPVVRDGFLIVALCAAIFTLPIMAAIGIGGGAVLGYLNRLLGVSWSVPLGVLFVAAGVIATAPAVLIVAGRTSRYILECTRWHLDHADAESAKRLVRAKVQLIWHRDWKRNRWFRDFARESGLAQECVRLGKFTRRPPRDAVRPSGGPH